MEMHDKEDCTVQKMDTHPHSPLDNCMNILNGMLTGTSNMTSPNSPQVSVNGVCAESRIPPGDGSLSRPPSPCDSEISVGCEQHDRANNNIKNNNNKVVNKCAGSPMDMSADVNFTTEEDDEGNDTEPHSPYTPRGTASPALSSTSLHTESYTYLSDDEYFRPLKRLAMSSSSPTPSEQLHLIRQSHSTSPNSSPQMVSPAAITSCSLLESRPPHVLSPPLIKKSLDDDEEETGDEASEAEARNQRLERSLQEEKNNRLRSFSILDILSYKPSRRKSSVPVKIVRPWDSREDKKPENRGANRNDNGGKQESGKSGKQDKGGALDALFKMTNKTLDNLNKEDKTGMSGHTFLKNIFI